MPPRLPIHPLRPSPTSSTRTYAQITQLPPLPRPSKKERAAYRHPAGELRVYPESKRFCMTSYADLIHRSPVLVLIGYDNLPTAVMGKIRRELKRASPVLPPELWPPAEQRDPPILPPSLPPLPLSRPLDASTHPRASLHVIRPGLFSALLRIAYPNLSRASSILHGPVAALSYPVSHPPALGAILRVLDRALPRKQQLEEGQDPKKLPQFRILAALVDWEKVLDENGLREAAKLPTLDVLRSQIVGLIAGPAGAVGGVLGAARGGRAVGLLESWRKGREEKEGGGAEGGEKEKEQ